MCDLRFVMLLLLLFLLLLFLLLQLFLCLLHLLDFIYPSRTSCIQTRVLLLQVLQNIIEVVNCRNEDFVVLILRHSQTLN